MQAPTCKPSCKQAQSAHPLFRVHRVLPERGLDVERGQVLQAVAKVLRQQVRHAAVLGTCVRDGRSGVRCLPRFEGRRVNWRHVDHKGTIDACHMILCSHQHKGTAPCTTLAGCTPGLERPDNMAKPAGPSTVLRAPTKAACTRHGQHGANTKARDNAQVPEQ